MSLLATALQRRLAGGSFWWSCAQEGSDCALLPGLPAAGGFAAMLLAGPSRVVAV